MATCQSHFTHTLIEYGYTAVFQINIGKVCGMHRQDCFLSYNVEYMILEEGLYLDELAQRQQPLIYKAINVTVHDIYPQPTC